MGRQMATVKAVVVLESKMFYATYLILPGRYVIPRLLHLSGMDLNGEVSARGGGALGRTRKKATRDAYSS